MRYFSSFCAPLAGVVLAALSVLGLVIPVQSAELTIPEGVIFTRDIEYANPDGKHLQLNLAVPKQATGPFPVVLCFHGGALTHGTRDGCNRICIALAEHGIAAATVTYRLAPADKFPAALYDAKAAVRWARAQAATYHFDPLRVGITGDSAGGFLAHFVGVTNGVREFEGDQNLGFGSDVCCVGVEFGPVDFTRGNGRSMFSDSMLSTWLGGAAADMHRRSAWASPLNWVTPAAVPTLILHGTADQSVDYQQSVWMRDRLAACGVEVKLVTVEGAGHGFKGADSEKADKELVAFFVAHLKPSSR